MKPIHMNLREFTKAHQTGVFKEAVIQSTAGNKFYIVGRCPSGDDAILTRLDDKVRLFCKLDPPVKLLHDIGFQDMRVSLAKWSPAQATLPV